MFNKHFRSLLQNVSILTEGEPDRAGKLFCAVSLFPAAGALQRCSGNVKQAIVTLLEHCLFGIQAVGCGGFCLYLGSLMPHWYHLSQTSNHSPTSGSSDSKKHPSSHGRPAKGRVLNSFTGCRAYRSNSSTLERRNAISSSQRST